MADIAAIALLVAALGATGETGASLTVRVTAAVVVTATVTAPGSTEWGKAEEKRGPWRGHGAVDRAALGGRTGPVNRGWWPLEDGADRPRGPARRAAEARLPPGAPVPAGTAAAAGGKRSLPPPRLPGSPCARPCGTSAGPGPVTARGVNPPQTRETRGLTAPAAACRGNRPAVTPLGRVGGWLCRTEDAEEEEIKVRVPACVLVRGGCKEVHLGGLGQWPPALLLGGGVSQVSQWVLQGQG